MPSTPSRPRSQLADLVLGSCHRPSLPSEGWISKRHFTPIVGYQSDILFQWLDIKAIFHSNGWISKRYFTPMVGYQSDISLQWLDIKAIFHSNGWISNRYFTQMVGYQSDISLHWLDIKAIFHSSQRESSWHSSTRFSLSRLPMSSHLLTLDCVPRATRDLVYLEPFSLWLELHLTKLPYPPRTA